MLQKIKDCIVPAMKAKDKDRVTSLKTVVSELVLSKSRAEESGKPFGDAEVIATLRKMRKNAETIGDTKEIAIIDEFVPALMSEEDIKSAIEAIIFNANIPKTKGSMGRIMGLFTKEHKGKADNKVVSRLVREALDSGHTTI